MSDAELLAAGLEHFRNDRYLAGAPLFHQIKDRSLIDDNKENAEFLRRSNVAVKLRADLSQPISEGGWTKQGESHGDRDFITYYKTQDGGKLKCRIESVIESSLYVPFLATMNETDLYDTFFPKWHFPFKLGIHRSLKLQQCGRTEQLVQLTVDLPFPLRKREIVFHAFCDDDCANDDTGGTVGAKLVSVDESFDDASGIVPPPESGIVRMGFEADFLFRACPKDHAALQKTNASKSKYPEGEQLILLTFVMSVDPHIVFVPQSFMNFATRTAIGSVWKQILRISEEVREGQRLEHAALIAQKREELYDWVEERAKLMTGPAETAKDKLDTTEETAVEET